MKRFFSPKASLLCRAAVLLALGLGGLGSLSAQTRPNDLGGQQYDVFLGAKKIVQLDRFVEDVTSSDSNRVRVEKVAGSETQIELTGISIGSATVTVRSGTGSITYNVNVSPQPQRIYINVPENRRITFTGEVEAYTVSVQRIINVRQPDDNVLVIEALQEGRTALNVTSGGEVYRYFISTFSNRGADKLEIKNAFTKKGYRFLQIEFERDQAIITGTVPTQEELDDAVRIVKNYTPYVDVRAVVGAVGLDYAESEEERIIINNIKRIAELPDLIVKVKFQQPAETRTSTFTRVAGNPALRTSVTDNETRLTTDTIDLPPADAGSGLLERPVQEGTIEEITRSEDYTVPEKIFLFGELKDDLEEARAIRVARTYCPLIVSMVTVKDPIQLRMKVRFVQVDYDKVKNTGVLWTNGDGINAPEVALTLTGNPLFQEMQAFTQNIGQGLSGAGVSTSSVTRNFTYGLTVNATATLQLTETEGWGEVLDESDILMINGQPGELFSGQQIPYTASFAVTENGTVIPSIAFINVGIQVTVVPLNFAKASQIPGERQQILTADGQEVIQALQKFGQIEQVIGNQVLAPFVDESTKYVDENGLIGVECFASISALDPSAGVDGFRNIGNGFFAPQTLDSTSSARAYLREGQSVVIGGLLEEDTSRTLRKVPYLADIPIFGKLFEAQDNGSDNSELLIVYTPEIVRMANDDKSRMPEPTMPEMHDYLTKKGEVPILKRVRYDSGEVDLRPDLNRPAYEEPKNITYSKNISHDTAKQMDLPQSEPKDLDADDKMVSEPSEASDSSTYVPSFRATDSSTGSTSINPRPAESSTVDTSSAAENTSSDAGGSESTLP